MTTPPGVPLNPNIISEEYSDRAFYRMTVAPKRGSLILKGIVLKSGDVFTQLDIMNGDLIYKHDGRCETGTNVKDEFKFVIPISETQILTPQTPRSPCLPSAIIPKDGIFTFVINILTIPYPEKIRNREIEIMEDETRCFSRSDLYYTSDLEVIEEVRIDPADFEPIPGDEIFDKWSRFSANQVFANGAKDAPVDSPAKKWEYIQGEDTFRSTINSTTYIGITSPAIYDRYTMTATLSSTANDDDMISIILAYKVVGGQVHTLSAIRSGGGISANDNGGGNKDPANSTWCLASTVGNSRTMIIDKGSSAPATPDGMRLNWSKLGQTKVEAMRDGANISIVCSQFGSETLDESTRIDFVIPSNSPFADGAAIGFGAFSQNMATFADVSIKVDPTLPEKPLFDAHPIQYNVRTMSKQTKGTFMLDGAPLKLLDTFTNQDLDNGLLCINGNNAGSGVEQFSFSACTVPCKCMTDIFRVRIKEWPYPERVNNSVTIDECEDGQILTEDNLLYTVEKGSTKDQITYTFNPTRTNEVNPGYLSRVVPSTFTQADIAAGLVRIYHDCGAEFRRFDRLMFDICTQRGKCVEGSLAVTIIKKVINEPSTPGFTVDPAGCVYGMDFYGNWAPVGECGLWAEIVSRRLPDPETQTPGQILYLPNADPAVTLVVVKDPITNKNKYVTLPYNITEQPSGGCPIEEIAPETDKSKATIVTRLIFEEQLVSNQTPLIKTMRYAITVDGIEVHNDSVDMTTQKSFRDTPPRTFTLDNGSSGHYNYVDETIKVTFDKALLKENSVVKIRLLTPAPAEKRLYQYGQGTEIDYNKVIDPNTGQPTTIEWFPKRYSFGIRIMSMRVNATYAAPISYAYFGGGSDGQRLYEHYIAPVIKTKYHPTSIIDAHCICVWIKPAGAAKVIPAEAEFKEKWNLEAPYTSSQTDQPNCFTGPDGTKWVTDVTGEWRPVEPTNNNVNKDPLVKSDEYLVSAPDLKGEYEGKPVLLKPENNVFTPLPNGDLVMVEKPYTKIFQMDIFNWMGPNEFYLPYGRYFDLYFFSSRYYVRYDIMPQNGNTIVDQNDPSLWDDTTSKFLTGQVSTTINKFPMSPNVQKVFPWLTMFDGINGANASSLDGHKKSQYYVKLSGTNKLAGFVSTHQPINTELYTKKSPFKNGSDTKTDHNYMKVRNNPIWSYSGYGDLTTAGLKQYAVPPYGAYGNAVYGHLGERYGTFFPQLHFNLYTKHGNLHYRPPEPYIGWMNGQFMLMSTDHIKPGYRSQIDGTAPRSAVTYTFRVRGVDLVTGETKFRTFKVHYNATGIGPNGRSSIQTDAKDVAPGGVLPPNPDTAYCEYKGPGRIGSCVIEKNENGGTVNQPIDEDDFNDFFN